jgi:hypothetical protein
MFVKLEIISILFWSKERKKERKKAPFRSSAVLSDQTLIYEK